jgi:hypothetical protein
MTASTIPPLSEKQKEKEKKKKERKARLPDT